jgi:DNA-binding transcriptional MerR regulator
MAQALTIGRLAQATGVSAKTIRYYEQVGVCPAPRRTAAGYRQYTEQGVERLLFVRRARALGLSLHQVRALGLALDGPRGGVRPRLLGLIRAQLAAVHQRLSELQRLQGQLEEVLGRVQASSREGRRSRRCRCLDLRGS